MWKKRRGSSVKLQKTAAATPGNTKPIDLIYYQSVDATEHAT